jgi:transposase
MEYIQGNNRSQIVLISSSLEEMIPEDNPVRIIDLFVDSCNLEELSFSNAKLGPEGWPPYHPGDLLKLFIYGYLNRIRSSRCLERECQRIKTKACKECPVKSQCTTSPKDRLIECNENIEATQRNKRAIDNNKELYKRRQEIVEHPYGTMKRQWGFDHTLMKGKKKVDGEVGLIFIAYLFTRLKTILGLKRFKEAIAAFISHFSDTFSSIQSQIVYLEGISAIFSRNNNLYRVCLNSL